MKSVEIYYEEPYHPTYGMGKVTVEGAVVHLDERAWAIVCDCHNDTRNDWPLGYHPIGWFRKKGQVDSDYNFQTTRAAWEKLEDDMYGSTWERLRSYIQVES